jgi:RIO-like serine/threonine protein kinase
VDGVAVTIADGAPLKRDLFGEVRRVIVQFDGRAQDCVQRDTTLAARGLRWFARRLAAREARALQALRGMQGVPRLVSWDGRQLVRSWLPGVPMQAAGGVDRTYFREALRLLRRLHSAGLVHNDLAKEPNWLVSADGRPALVDFQLAMRPRYRGRLFRMLAHDDLRHLLKHKRTYCPQHLTAREREILARRSPLASAWAKTGKPVYRFVTRRLLGWADREGAGDRGAVQGSTVSKSSAGASPGRK